jgi:hypothetical protein
MPERIGRATPARAARHEDEIISSQREQLGQSERTTRWGQI